MDKITIMFNCYSQQGGQETNATIEGSHIYITEHSTLFSPLKDNRGVKLVSKDIPSVLGGHFKVGGEGGFVIPFNRKRTYSVFLDGHRYECSFSYENGWWAEPTK